MSRTIRKSRDDVKHPEGQGRHLRTYKCKCTYCTGKNKKIANIHLKEIGNQLEDHYTRFDDS